MKKMLLIKITLVYWVIESMSVEQNNASPTETINEYLD